MSDPFGRDWNLFGTVDYVIRFNLLSPTATSWIKIGAVIIGHIIAVTLAHDRAIEDNDPRPRGARPDPDARGDGRVYGDRAVAIAGVSAAARRRPSRAVPASSPR